jgi:hypothetical protein
LLTKPPESFEITFVAENYLGCEVKALAYSIPLSLILVIVTSITSKGNCSSVYNLHEAEEPNPI